MKLAARLAVLAAFVCLLATPASAADSLLPPEVAGVARADWKEVEAVNLETVSGDLASLLREYGSQGAESAVYGRGAALWRVTVHRMSDRSGAYGAFTLLRGAGQATTLGEAGVRNADGFLFYQGNYLVIASGPVKTESLVPLASALHGRSGEQASLPSLPDYLPEGHMAGSDHYVLGPVGLARVAPLAPGDWAGFAYGAEAEVARYQRGGREATLLIFNYPTPQIARARLADFQQLFNLNQEGKPTAPVVFGRRKGSLVVLVAGLDAKEPAEQLIEQMRFEPQLSWSDTHSEDLGTTVGGLLNLMIGTALLILVVLGLSLAFAGFRLGVKFWFPGRLFDKPSDEEELFLDLRPRR